MNVKFGRGAVSLRGPQAPFHLPENTSWHPPHPDTAQGGPQLWAVS